MTVCSRGIVWQTFSTSIMVFEIWISCSPWQDSTKHQTRFVSQKPAKVVLSSMEVVAQSMGFKTHIRNFKVDLTTFAIILVFFYFGYYFLQRM